MFYCGACGQARNWPVTGFTSFGPCEMCGSKTRCHEAPAIMLPGAPPSSPTSYQVSSYGRAGSDSRVHDRDIDRDAAEHLCRTLVQHGGREGAYVRRFPGHKIVYCFDRQDVGGG